MKFQITKKLFSTIRIITYLLVCVALFYYLFANSHNLPTIPNGLQRAGSQAKEVVDTPPIRKKAALVSLVRNTDLFGMRKTIRQIEDRFNYKYNYPYIFLNDVPFTEEFKKGIQSLTSSNVTFDTLDSESWGYPPWIDREKAKQARDKADYINGKSESYRFMCRFQSGYVYRHPLLKNLDFYWRIEPDVKYFCDIDYDPFDFMAKNKKVYGWNMAPNEYMKTIPTLWKVTKDFMKEYPEHINENNLLKWATNEKGEYNGCHFWTNFEVVDLKFYRSKAYSDYFNFLDKSGGFFYERWGDAPVHTLAVAMFLSKDQVHFFKDIGYYHPAMGSCPKDSDRIGKCVCNPKEHNQMSYGCVRSWLDLK
ncbi:hypothetical protein BB560_004441 [Smittium megazygosporum]|uniref:Glycosyltransferase family 15 protein n=1 Tax=Smittium megazygosporum TaxID=133381 RepID=A0A2T9Z981_9FUNG|nr:hypothetical protein BB560_004441 [Smittium megazygosporum]